MGVGQKKGFRHSQETKERIRETMKAKGKPNGFNMVRPCPVCGEEFSVTNHTRHVRACETRAKHQALAGRSLASIKMMRICLRQYGLTLEGYFDLLQKQRGGCAICGSPGGPDDKRLHVDHCHETGGVRGLLCSPCNVTLGMFRDDPERLRAAADYLETTDARDYDRDGWDGATPKIVDQRRRDGL